jgi:hypothetical protein
LFRVAALLTGCYRIGSAFTARSTRGNHGIADGDDSRNVKQRGRDRDGGKWHSAAAQFLPTHHGFDASFWPAD